MYFPPALSPHVLTEGASTSNSRAGRVCPRLDLSEHGHYPGHIDWFKDGHVTETRPVTFPLSSFWWNPWKRGCSFPLGLLEHKPGRTVTSLLSRGESGSENRANKWQHAVTEGDSFFLTFFGNTERFLFLFFPWVVWVGFLSLALKRGWWMGRMAGFRPEHTFLSLRSLHSPPHLGASPRAVVPWA